MASILPNVVPRCLLLECLRMEVQKAVVDKKRENTRKANLVKDLISRENARVLQKQKHIARIRGELAKVDRSVSDQINILRNKIDRADRGFSEAQRIFKSAEENCRTMLLLDGREGGGEYESRKPSTTKTNPLSRYLKAKAKLEKATKMKQLLSQHLAQILIHVEEEKAARLENLLRDLNIKSSAAKGDDNGDGEEDQNSSQLTQQQQQQQQQKQKHNDNDDKNQEPSSVMQTGNSNGDDSKSNDRKEENREESIPQIPKARPRQQQQAREREEMKDRMSSKKITTTKLLLSSVIRRDIVDLFQRREEGATAMGSFAGFDDNGEDDMTTDQDEDLT
eukprot:jgi/Bigna1/76057/fgenesh1_pg.38_\